MDGGAWSATVHVVTKSRTRLHFQFLCFLRSIDQEVFHGEGIIFRILKQYNFIQALITFRCKMLFVYLTLNLLRMLVAQSFLAVCDRMDCSPPSSSVHVVLQARKLEWVAIPCSRGSSRPRDGNLHWRQILYCLSDQRIWPLNSLHCSYLLGCVSWMFHPYSKQSCEKPSCNSIGVGILFDNKNWAIKKWR